MQLIVVGFHRSGTSLLTQLLHAAGLFVGDDLLGAMPSNPYGHFEDRGVLELHRQILSDHGLGWQVDHPVDFHLSRENWRWMQDFVGRRDREHRDWGFKEPRACLFLGAWKYVAPDAKFVIVYRDPSECVRSMTSRQATDYFNRSGPLEDHLRFFREPDHGLKLWDTYNRAILHFAAQHVDDCLVVPFTHLSNGYPVVSRINQRFGSSLEEVPTEAVFDAQATSSRDHALWVHDRHALARATNTWRRLESLTALTGASV